MQSPRPPRTARCRAWAPGGSCASEGFRARSSVLRRATAVYGGIRGRVQRIVAAAAGGACGGVAVTTMESVDRAYGLREFTLPAPARSANRLRRWIFTRSCAMVAAKTLRRLIAQGPRTSQCVPLPRLRAVWAEDAIDLTDGARAGRLTQNRRSASLRDPVERGLFPPWPSGSGEGAPLGIGKEKRDWHENIADREAH